MADQQRQSSGQERPQGTPDLVRDENRTGNKPPRSDDRSKVGQDTDGDGKVVQPGQKPGQSHGTGVIEKK